MKTDKNEVVIAIVSCPGRPVASALAKSLVESRLAACATLCPGVESVYWWEGEICTTPEALLLIKTTPDKIPELKDAIVAQHPYEVPEIIVVSATDCFEPYAQWVASTTHNVEDLG